MMRRARVAAATAGGGLSSPQTVRPSSIKPIFQSLILLLLFLPWWPELVKNLNVRRYNVRYFSVCVFAPIRVIESCRKIISYSIVTLLRTGHSACTLIVNESIGPRYAVDSTYIHIGQLQIWREREISFPFSRLVEGWIELKETWGLLL